MSNGVVCFAVMLFPCSAVEIAGTSPIRADNDFILCCISLCVCVFGKEEREQECVCVCERKVRDTTAERKKDQVN